MTNNAVDIIKIPSRIQSRREVLRCCVRICENGSGLRKYETHQFVWGSMFDFDGVNQLNLHLVHALVDLETPRGEVEGLFAPQDLAESDGGRGEHVELFVRVKLSIHCKGGEEYSWFNQG